MTAYPTAFKGNHHLKNLLLTLAETHRNKPAPARQTAPITRLLNAANIADPASEAGLSPTLVALADHLGAALEETEYNNENSEPCKDALEWPGQFILSIVPGTDTNLGLHKFIGTLTGDINKLFFESKIHRLLEDVITLAEHRAKGLPRPATPDLSAPVRAAAEMASTPGKEDKQNKENIIGHAILNLLPVLTTEDEGAHAGKLTAAIKTLAELYPAPATWYRSQCRTLTGILSNETATAATAGVNPRGPITGIYGPDTEEGGVAYTVGDPFVTGKYGTITISGITPDPQEDGWLNVQARIHDDRKPDFTYARVNTRYLETITYAPEQP